ncbi:MAG: hypothetical protein WBG57_06775 [Ornithinimicrobium sp.]
MPIPLEEVEIRAGYVDDISEFDRFTGGQTLEMRRRVGDQFAERTFLRIMLDGEEEDIDALLGRTPKSQAKAAEKLFAEIERARRGVTPYRSSTSRRRLSPSSSVTTSEAPMVGPPTQSDTGLRRTNPTGSVGL